MTYKLLLPQLRPVADGAAVFLKREWGIQSPKAEVGAHKETKFVPTFHAKMRDHHTLWVEVSNRPYPPHLDGIVSDCMQHGLPVRIVVAVPAAGRKSKIFHEDLTRARMKGVGVITVDGNNGEILATPLSQSLAAVHPIQRSEFPSKFRFQLAQAESTFKQGDPAKGCDNVYGIIEDISRKVAEATHTKGLWRPGGSPPRFDKDPWNSVMDNLVKNVDTARCKYFDDNILHRIIGVIPYRNKVVHVVKNNKELRERDRMLRTRFEDAANILFELLNDAKPLKI